MKKLLRWLSRIFIISSVLIAVILAIAYWNREAFFRKINDKLNERVNGKFHIEKIDFTFFHRFPSFSITLHDVHLRSDTYDTYPVDVFYAKKIFVDIRLFPLIRKEIEIKALTLSEADIFIFRTKNGYTNAEVFKPKQDATAEQGDKKTSLFFTLKKAGLRNVSVNYCDSVKNKVIRFTFVKTNHTLAHIDSTYAVSIKGSMYIDSLMFNPEAGSFLRKKSFTAELQIELNTISNILTIKPSLVNFQKSVLNISGYFALKKNQEYYFKMKSDENDPTETIPLLNTRLSQSLNRFHIKTPVDVTVELKGSRAQIPDVDIQFFTKNASLDYHNLSFTQATIKGSFTNHLSNAEEKKPSNTRLTVSSFKGTMQRIPIIGHVTFTALNDPVINAFVKTELPYSDVNNFINTNRLILRSGTFKSEIRYKGKLDEYLDSTRTKYNGSLNGQVSVSDVSLYYKPKKMLITKINAACAFTEKKLNFTTISLDLNGSLIHMKGSMLNFIPFFIQPKNKTVIRLAINSDDLDLTPFSAKTKQERKHLQQPKNSSKKITDLFDKVYNTMEFDLDLKVKNLIFRTFKASDFSGQITLLNNTLKARPISMRIADGTASLNLTLSKLFDPISPLAIDLTMTDANIKNLFQGFNNFNQQTIQSENLSGTITADVKFKADIDDRYTILPPTMKGKLVCKIKDGVLKDFEPIQNMSNFLFKRRDFSNVQFAELNSNFTVDGTSIEIKKMEIQSSVLSLFLQGHYSFTDSTSLSVQLPLSNLKKRQKDFKPENIGLDKKAGPSVFLHIYRNKDLDKMTIAYDPFKVWVK